MTVLRDALSESLPAWELYPVLGQEPCVWCGKPTEGRAGRTDESVLQIPLCHECWEIQR